MPLKSTIVKMKSKVFDKLLLILKAFKLIFQQIFQTKVIYHSKRHNCLTVSTEQNMALWALLKCTSLFNLLCRSRAPLPCHVHPYHICCWPISRRIACCVLSDMHKNPFFWLLTYYFDTSVRSNYIIPPKHRKTWIDWIGRNSFKSDNDDFPHIQSLTKVALEKRASRNLWNKNKPLHRATFIKKKSLILYVPSK